MDGYIYVYIMLLFWITVIHAAVSNALIFKEITCPGFYEGFFLTSLKETIKLKLVN